MSEFDLQRYAVQLLALTAPKDCLWFCVPNGEHRSKRTGARLKAMGVRRGVSDLAFTPPPGGRSAYLELKSEKGRPSPEQRVFRADAENAGALYAVASNPDEVLHVLSTWGAIRRSSLTITITEAP